MKKGIIISPEDFAGVDWVQKASSAGLDTLAFHTGGPNHDLIEALKEVSTPAFHKRCADAGLNCEYEEHAAGQFLPHSLFETHPEYFACNKEGVRTAGARANWCLSSPGMRQRVVDGAKLLADALYTSSHRYYFWSADCSDSICRCPACAKYSAADMNILNANAIAEGVRKSDPLAQVAVLAYTGSSFDLPQKAVPHEALFLEFAPYRRSFTSSIAEDKDEINTYYRKALLKLLQFFPAERTHLLEYWLDISWFSGYRRPLKKTPLTRDILKRDLEFYTKCGITNFSTFAVMMDGSYFDQYGDEELMFYGELLNEFCSVPQAGR